jgi:hypothetical protein
LLRFEVEQERGGSITAAVVAPTDDPGAETSMVSDYYVAALPVEAMQKVLTPDLRAADPSLNALDILKDDVDWMNGVLFFLNREVPIVRGHVTYIDSDLALTSISQAQFWPGGLAGYGDGSVRDILSVVVSDWTNAKTLACGSADECRAKVIAAVWEQIKASVNVDGTEVLTDDMIVKAWIDPDIIFDPAPKDNLEPLLVNKKGKWPLRPNAYTAIPNLFLASDYVKTHTNLATMEAANEAARRAVNALLLRERRAADVDVWPLYVPPAMKVLQDLDCMAYRLGHPWREPAEFHAVRMSFVERWEAERQRSPAQELANDSRPSS